MKGTALQSHFWMIAILLMASITVPVVLAKSQGTSFVAVPDVEKPFDESKDPKIGQSVNLPIKFTPRLLVIGTMGCSSCSLKAVSLQLKSVRLKSPFTLLYPNTDEGPINVQLAKPVSVTKSEMDSINLVFGPRGYLFANDGRLLDLQSHTETLLEFIKRCHLA